MDPSYPEHNDVVDLAGKRFDPEAFDREKVNQQLEVYARNAKGLDA